ncbi:MAG: sialidase family protein, partial [Armatimonadota bacterium]
PFVALSDGSLLTIGANEALVSGDDGATWEKRATMYEGEGPGIPRGGPMVRTADGTLVLVYMDLEDYVFDWDPATGELNADLDVWAIRSVDEGHTWVDRQKILDGYCGSLQNVIQTGSGRIVVPVQDAITDPLRHGQYCFVSDDDGQTWRRGNLIDLGGRGDHDGGFEATVVERTDGTVWMLIRTNLDRFWEATSETDGLYWRRLGPGDIDASSSPGFLLRLDSGRIVLAWNRLYPEGLSEEERAEYPRRGGGRLSETNASWQRDELSIAFSEDDGRTWTEPVVVARKQGGNLSYPYIFERRPGELWITTGGGPTRIVVTEEDFVE